MRLTATDIDGARLVELEPHADERGFFARTYCEREFAEAGVALPVMQASVSWNICRGTVRGLHFQRAPSREGKLVRCTRGAIFDALVDLRTDSPTFGRKVGLRLDMDNHRALYVPPGVAHGFQTLEDNTEVLYQMSDVFAPELADGVRWNDPAFGVEWPLEVSVIHPRDASYPDFEGRRS